MEELSAVSLFSLYLREKFAFCEKAVFLEEDELFSSCDYCLAIGGDGSVLHASKKAARYNKPILGINTGYLAFMAGAEKNELELLERLCSRDFSIEKRMLLRAELFEKDKKVYETFCLNDAVLSRAPEAAMAKLRVQCNGNLVNEYRADGLVFSTPTGSTAYSLSAGGTVVDPTLDCILLTPVSSHSLMSRPLIFNAESKLSVSLSEDLNNRVLLSCDGEKCIKIKKNSRLEITKAQRTVDFIKLKNDTFWEVLYSKLFRN